MTLSALFILIFPIAIVFALRDLVDELRNPSAIREQADSASSTFTFFDGGGGDSGCDTGGYGCH